MTPHSDTKALKNIALVVFDFDGVMTDNRVLVFPDGNEAVWCNRSDGLGIDALHKEGVPMIVLSMEKQSVVAARCKKLRIPCHQGIDDKAGYLADYLRRESVDPKTVAYVGNDTNDVGCLTMVGLPVVVADAHPHAKAAARIVLTKNGGEGAVQEFSERLLAARAA